MVRVCLFSEDRRLQSLLSVALGKEFELFTILDEEEISRMLSAGDCDVVLLDLNSNHERVQMRVEFARQSVKSQPPWVILADDGLRSTATELVQLGGFGYCRRPPSIPDLRAMLRRAYQCSALTILLYS